MDKSILKEENIIVRQNGTTMQCFAVYQSADEHKRPGILVVPEWWGMTDYIKMRARKLADLGYIAMAVDIYGDEKVAQDPDTAKKYASPFYQNPQLAKDRLDSAIKKIKEYKQTDSGKIAAIGYCFGGAVVLNSAKLGVELKGVVSFHGSLPGIPAKKGILKSKILVCHGMDDAGIKNEDIEQFHEQMESCGADFTFKEYPGAAHGFTNPSATETGQRFKIPIAYNADADASSWNDMLTFFNRIFE